MKGGEKIQNTYNGKKVLVTGHTGFKGSWLSFWLHSLGADVLGYSLPPESDNNLYDLIKGGFSHHSVFGDIRDYHDFSRSIEEFGPDFIFHLAAQPLVRKSYEFPVETYKTNVIGTGNLMKALGALKSKCTVVIITTDKVYHNNEWHYPYRESDRLGGYDPYSSSKACAEILVESFKNSFYHIDDFSNHEKAIATARAGNVIGGGDWSKDRIIPDIVNSLIQSKSIDIRNPKAVRPWQHVLEPLSGYLLLGSLLAENPVEFSGSWNFGPFSSDHLTVEDLVKIAIKSWGSGDYKIVNLKNQPHEAGLLKLDINKTMNQLNWLPKLNSTESIRWTMDWYKRCNQGAKAVDLLKEDLDKFLKI